MLNVDSVNSQLSSGSYPGVQIKQYCTSDIYKQITLTLSVILLKVGVM